MRIVGIMGWGRGPIGEFVKKIFDWLDYPEGNDRFCNLTSHSKAHALKFPGLFLKF